MKQFHELVVQNYPEQTFRLHFQMSRESAEKLKQILGISFYLKRILCRPMAAVPKKMLYYFLMLSIF